MSEKIYQVVNQQIPLFVECPSGYIVNLNMIVDLDIDDDLGLPIYRITLLNQDGTMELSEEDYNFLRGALLDGE